jgi:chemotaxis family two-component system sensor kinase Cph1
MKPQDFEQLLANCADEPIRFPGAIQPHGVLLTLSEPDLKIIQVSANVATLFNRTPEALLGQPLHSLIGTEHAQAVQAMAELNTFTDAPPLSSKVCCTATKMCWCWNSNPTSRIFNHGP